MCNYADDIKTVTSGSLDKPTADTAGATASINPATSGVTAGSGPDMWEPMTIVVTSHPGLFDVMAVAVNGIFLSVLKAAGIGHKKVLIVDQIEDGAGPGVGFLIKTSDVARLDEYALAETGNDDPFYDRLFELSSADYRGGGKHRRHMTLSDGSTNPEREWLVERSRDFAVKQDIYYMTDVNGRDTYFVGLSDAETRNG